MANGKCEIVPRIFVFRSTASVQWNDFIPAYSGLAYWTNLPGRSGLQPLMQTWPTGCIVIRLSGEINFQCIVTRIRIIYQNRWPHILTTASFAVSRQMLHSNILSSLSFSFSLSSADPADPDGLDGPACSLVLLILSISCEHIHTFMRTIHSSQMIIRL